LSSFTRVFVTAVILCAAVASTACGAQAQKLTTVEEQHLLEKARRAYYYAAFPEGVPLPLSFDLRIDYRTEFQNDPRSRTDAIFREQVLPALLGVRFHVAMSEAPNGEVGLQIEPRLSVTPKSDEAARRTLSVARSTIPLLQNVLRNWVLYGGIGPHSHNSSHVEFTEDGYRVVQDSPGAEASILMNRAYVIRQWRIGTSDGSMIVNPIFASTGRGLLITEWDVAFDKRPESNYRVHVDYQDVNGVRLPGSMTLNMNLPGEGLMTVPISFSNHQFGK
jgi:hypothetical protein